jgi:RNA binding exosome subunit
MGERRRHMLRRLVRPTFLVTMLSLTLSPVASAGIGDFLKDLQKSVGVSEGLSESKIIEGLKEALEIGTSNAVQVVSKVNGYYGNPQIKIPLPDSVKKVEKALRAVGYGSKVDAFELSMNRAAERAAPEAKALFVDSIKQMSFEDARKILNGRENEATLYFEDKTRSKLTEIFKPIVHSSMSQVGVTRQYQALDSKVRTIPFTESLSFDLDQYVTDGALDGLFLMLAKEEQKIRQDPAARVTDLLKEVFGK